MPVALAGTVLQNSLAAMVFDRPGLARVGKYILDSQLRGLRELRGDRPGVGEIVRLGMH